MMTTRKRSWLVTAMTSVCFVLVTFLLCPPAIQAYHTDESNVNDESDNVRLLQTQENGYIIGWKTPTSHQAAQPPPTPHPSQKANEITSEPSKPDFKLSTSVPTLHPTMEPSASPGPSELPSFFSSSSLSPSTQLAVVIDPQFDRPLQEDTVSPTTSAPSSTPTGSPTEQPSILPSTLPSSSPTDRPSNVPSQIPSQSPSSTPTGSPTEQPSTTPSTTPSTLSSSSPTSRPSNVPAQIPSQSPSSSTYPSHSPSQEPSATSMHPSSHPSSSPSSLPSSAPSGLPGGLPSGLPSESPSSAPSDLPSSSPSSLPSLNPSTSTPTGSPTEQLSTAPSTLSSSSPTGRPSNVPSQIPSQSPSSSIYPSHSPSQEPSASMHPSSYPSSSPSSLPSSAPSRSPSSLPSSLPSESPSSFPSDLPSSSPSSLPSLNPSTEPSAEPTSSSSLDPSEAPSNYISRGGEGEPEIDAMGADFCTPDAPCAHCVGDCDTDDDCQGNLICHQRDSKEPVPSCSGGEESESFTDYCIDPFWSGRQGTPSSPTTASALSPTAASTDFFADTAFYVIADTPYTEEERLDMPRLISSIHDDALFAIHLGDIKHKSEPCNNETFHRFASYLEQSPIPFFVVPGDNEFTKCESPTAALEIWRQNFVRFDQKHWNHTIDVQTMPDRPETFWFVNRGTLFIGLNIVGLPRRDKAEWEDRLSTQAEWTIDLIEERREGDDAIGAIVIMAHAQLRSRDHRHFLDPLIDYIDDGLNNEIPIMYVQGDVHSWAYNKKYHDQSSLVRVRKNSGTEDPALKIITHPTRAGVMARKSIDGSDMFDVIRFPEMYETH